VPFGTDPRKPPARFLPRKREREQEAMHSRSIVNPRTLSVLRAVFAALALTMFGTAAAEDSDGTDAVTTTPKQAESPESWFQLDALSLNVYGLAYHPDRDTVHRENLDNEFNPGLGLHYELTNTARGVSFTEVGAYRDSGSNWAKFASLGYQFKLGESWRIGGAIAAFNSQTYNRGVTFLGMIPLVTYDLGPIQLNAVYFPKFANYNEVAAFGFYATLPVGKWLR